MRARKCGLCSQVTPGSNWRSGFFVGFIFCLFFFWKTNKDITERYNPKNRIIEAGITSNNCHIKETHTHISSIYLFVEIHNL